MKNLILITLLFFGSLFANGQTILDTTFVTWKAKVFLPANWDGNADSSRQCIVFCYGAGQTGAAPYTDLDNYGPIAYLVSGWDGGITIVNGTHYPVIIGLQQSGAFMTSGQTASRLDAIRARYKIKKGNLHTSGWSSGGHAFKIQATEDAFDDVAPFGPFTYADGFKSLVDVQGVLPDDNSFWYDKAKNFARNNVTGGGKYLAFWGTADGDRQIPRFRDSMNAVAPGSAVVFSTSDGHNSAAVDRIFGSLAGAAPQNFTIGGSSMNAYQWMIRQGDTTLGAPPAPGTPNAGTDTTVYLNQTRPDSVFLNGTGSTATSYTWTKVSGPGTPTIVSASSASSWVTGLEAGDYVFRLTVNGGTTDNVSVFVIDYMTKNLRPCRVGAKQSFTLTPTAGEIYRPYITRDNVLPSLQGGDTIFIQGGTYTSGVELGDFGGSPGCPIVVAAKDEPVVITNGGFFRFGARDSNMVAYVKVDGTTLRGAGHPYGFVSTHTTYNGEGLTANNVHHFEVTGVNVNKKAVGMLVKKNSAVYKFSQFDKIILRSIRIYDNYIRNIEGEGLYIGHTDNTGTQVGNSSGYGPPPRGDSLEIFNNVVDSTGWDGIQASNFLNGVKVYNNFIYRAGQTNNSSQQHGIIVGSNIFGPQIYNNTVINVTGGGVSVFSYGPALISNNFLDSVAKSGTGAEKGIYIKRNAVSPETIEALTPTVTGNFIKGAESAAIYTDYTPGTDGGSITGNYYQSNGTNGIQNNSGATASGNTTVSSMSVTVNGTSKTSTGYSLNVTANGTTSTFTSAQALNAWLFEQLTGPPPPAPEVKPRSKQHRRYFKRPRNG